MSCRHAWATILLHILLSSTEHINLCWHTSMSWQKAAKYILLLSSSVSLCTNLSSRHKFKFLSSHNMVKKMMTLSFWNLWCLCVYASFKNLAYLFLFQGNLREFIYKTWKPTHHFSKELFWITLTASTNNHNLFCTFMHMSRSPPCYVRKQNT